MSYRLPNPASLTHDERMQYRAAQVGSRYNGSTPETLGDGSAIYPGFSRHTCKSSSQGRISSIASVS